MEAGSPEDLLDDTNPGNSPLANSGAYQELEFNLEELRARTQVDFNLFCKLVLPEQIKYDFPPFYLAVFRLMTSKLDSSKDFSKYAIGIPRGFGKTLFLKLVTAWIFAHTEKRYGLYVCAKEDLAGAAIKDITELILDSPNYKALYGNWRADKGTDRSALKSFTLQGVARTLQATGADSSIRGAQHNADRPDFIIFDDFQTRENALEVGQAAALYKKFKATFLELKSPEGCQFFFIGNLYPTKNCILYKLGESKYWISLITGALLQGGVALWPELYSREQILQDYEEACSDGTEEIFLSEKMNSKTASQLNGLDAELLAPYDSNYEVPFGKFIIVDPKTSKATHDQQVITAFYVYEAKPCAEDMIVGTFQEDDAIDATINLAVKHGIEAIFVEAVGYQYSLVDRFRKVLESRDLGRITVIDIYPGKASKVSRILTFFKDWQAGKVLIGKHVFSQVKSEALQFNPFRTNNVDDIIDVCSYAKTILESWQFLISTPAADYVNGHDAGQSAVLEENLC